MGCRFVGNFRGDLLNVGAEFRVLFADLREVGVNGVQLGGHGHDAGDWGADD